MTWGEFKRQVETQMQDRFSVPFGSTVNVDALPLGCIDINFRPSAEPAEGRFDGVTIGITPREQGDGDEVNITNGVKKRSMTRMDRRCCYRVDLLENRIEKWAFIATGLMFVPGVFPLAFLWILYG